MITIRKAKIKDVDAIVSMWHGLRLHHQRLVRRDKMRQAWNQPAKDAAPRFTKWVKKWIRSPQGCVLLGEVNGKPAGYSLNYIKDGIPVYAIKKLGYISDLYVKPEYRGKGVSSRLKDATFQWFKKKDIKYVEIGFHTENQKAHRIYKKWGFADYITQMRRRL
ncbi:GNAT family N-acetyltransferase [Candidatus Woesearchaeota archaeon]|nr:GNAT family N-acetyltransferase [Candidatus Woesearchaeota archaeon]